VTAGGRSAKFPLFLSSVTEQVLATGVSAGFGLVDDSALASVYLPKEPDLVLKQASAASTAGSDAKLALVVKAMAGVHLVAAAEAMCLGSRVGLETGQLFEIISGAAGASTMFVERVPQLLSGKWTSTKTVNNVIYDLVCVGSSSSHFRQQRCLHATDTKADRSNRRRGSNEIPTPSHRGSSAIVPTAATARARK
jgi:3-hydroxyisobutyrate dehydrogenase